MIPNDPFIITDVRRGSIAYRTGSLSIGDRLLAIDNKTLDHSNLETSFQQLQTSPEEVITLKVEKNDLEENLIIYTIELAKKNGSLGITICGSETGTEGVILAKLTEGGIAEKTGALHVGDRILAINGEPVDKRPLSEAIKLLQLSGENVQLKIARGFQSDFSGHQNENFERGPSFYEQEVINYGITGLSYGSPGIGSVDSAVESWDSGIIDSFTVDTHTGKIFDSGIVFHQKISTSGIVFVLDQKPLWFLLNFN